MVGAVQHYNVATRKLEQPIDGKVKKLLDLALVKKIRTGLYQVSPIPDYNITTYIIQEAYGRLVCNCQGFHARKHCAHVDAVRIFRERTESGTEQLQMNLPLSL